MQYLQRAWNLAETRGYLTCPELVALQDRVPHWFRALGTADGLAQFEASRKVKMPAALREFYGCLPLACFLEGGAIDGEVFLTDLDDLFGDPPPLITWPSGAHLVFAFHGHSGLVCAAELGTDDPRVYWGSDDEPYRYDSRPTVSFAEWVFAAVDGYEKTMDFWQGQYQKHGGEWIRKLVGMGERLGRK